MALAELKVTKVDYHDKMKSECFFIKSNQDTS